MTIDADDWRALARSAPWLWQTLRCTVTAAPAETFEGYPALEVWTTRTGELRAWTPAGELVVERTADEGFGGRARPLVAGGWAAGMPARSVEKPLTPAAELLARREARLLEEQRGERRRAAVRRPDGLVLRREDFRGDLDVPLISSYLWVAVMDPRELVDGQDPETGAEVPGCSVEDVRVVSHDGREAWAATVTPLASYDPRCSCCPLLVGRVSDQLMVRTGERDEVRPGGAESFAVWLDRGTGVVSRLRALDGDRAGAGFDLHVLEVDGPRP